MRQYTGNSHARYHRALSQPGSASLPSNTINCLEGGNSEVRCDTNYYKVVKYYGRKHGGLMMF